MAYEIIVRHLLKLIMEKGAEMLPFLLQKLPNHAIIYWKLRFWNK